MNRNVFFLAIAEIFSGIARGSYLACVGWTALLISNDVGKVGQLVVVGMIANIISGPAIGVLVDRQSRVALVILANCGMALVMFGLGQVWLVQSDPALLWLAIGVIVITALRLLHNSCHDALIKTSVSVEKLVYAIARFRMLHLTSTAVGMASAGKTIETLGPNAGFLLSALASALFVIPMLFVKSPLLHALGKGQLGIFNGYLEGIAILKSNSTMLGLTFLAAVSLPVGQLMNAVLSSFVRDDLSLGSSAYGIIDSAWALGGVVAALMMSSGIKTVSQKHMPYLFSGLAGLMTVGFACFTSVPMLAFLHGAMGCTVWITRIAIDGRLLQICSSDHVGRIKVNVEMAFSISAILMCLSPTILQFPNTSIYFLFWGMWMIIGSIALWLVSYNTMKEEC